MTVATLGFQIDSSQASSAAVDLAKLYAAAAKMETAADSLANSAGALANALKRVGDETKKVPPAARPFEQQDEHVRAFRAEIERLTMKYQPLAQATKSYEASVSEINRAHQLGIISAQQMQKALDGERLAFERLKTSATGAGQAIQAANTNNRMGRQGFNAANAGYQFQDIAVTAAMGMNPLMIGLQQGTQLASVVSSMERPVAGLAAAFASLISPVSLVTIGLTAGTAALIQYFATSSEGSDGMSDDLREQVELITRVAERWGDATPKLQAYADELTRVAEANERLAAGNAAAEAQLRPIVDVLGTINEQYTAAIRNLRGGGEETSEAVRAITTTFATLQSRIQDGKATTDDLRAAQDALSQAIDKYGIPSLQRLQDVFGELTPKIEAAIKAAQGFRDEAAGSISPTLGAMSELFSEGGRFYSPEDLIPSNVPIPQRRPRIELGEGWSPSGEAPTIVNSDGRLVPVPVPGQRPNYFEREADMPAFSRANRNTYWSREVLTEEQRRAELGGLFKGFFTDFGDALRNNSGDLGKALLEGLSNAVMNAASQAWEKVANLAANTLVNAVLGQPSVGLMNKQIGFTGANTTLGQILGAGGGLAANDNAAGGYSGLSNMLGYRAAIKGIESSGNYSALGPITRNGDRAYGAYQVMGNNIGPWSEAALGRRLTASEFLASPSLQDQIFDHRFGSYVSKYGPSGAAQAWFGGPGSVGSGGGAADILGTTGTAYVEKFNAALGDASKSVGTFGQGLGQIGQSLSTSFFPSAPAATGGGGGGGLFGWLSGIFSPNLSKYAGLTGLFADGTNYAPGGLAIVGERGPELVNLPQGSQVFDTNRSARMMGGNDNRGGNQRPQLTVYVQGASGDDHVRELARQGAQEAIYQYNENQVRAGFGDNQQKFNARKG